MLHGLTMIISLQEAKGNYLLFHQLYKHIKCKEVVLSRPTDTNTENNFTSSGGSRYKCSYVH